MILLSLVEETRRGAREQLLFSEVHPEVDILALLRGQLDEIETLTFFCCSSFHCYIT